MARDKASGAGAASQSTTKSASKVSTKPKQALSNLPTNLPGIRGEKVRRKKQKLIERAKVQKEYSKIKKREPLASNSRIPWEQEDAPDVDSKQMHPDRVHMLANADQEAHEGTGSGQVGNDPSFNPSGSQSQNRSKRGKIRSLNHAEQLGEQKRLERDEKRKAREQAEQERQNSRKVRERHRKAMAKARGRDGKRKLGRESGVLLERIQKMMSS